MTLRNRNILFTINESDVHEPADSDACIVFRKANHENPESHASTAEQFIKQCHLHSGTDSDDQPDVDGANDDDTDETGIEPNLKFHLVPNTAGSDEVAWHSTAIHWTWSDETIKDPNRDACLTADGERYSPSQIIAFALGKMMETQRCVHQGAVAVLV